MTKTKPFLSTCYWDPSATEVPPCCEAATRKLTFSTTSVLLLLDVPLSLSRGTIFRRQKNPRWGYRPKIAGILFVCNEPGRSIPYCAQLFLRDGKNAASVGPISLPSLAVAVNTGNHHARRAHKPQVVSDWLNPNSLGTMSAFSYIENLA